MESERTMALLRQPTHGVASERGLQWQRHNVEGAANRRRKETPVMAPKAKPDPALVAWAKELRQAVILEEKLKQLREMQNAPPPTAPTKARGRKQPPKKREAKKPR